MGQQVRQGLLGSRVESVVDRLCRQTPRAGASGQADALHSIRARQHQASCPHVARQTFQDGDPVVGVERGPSGEADRRPHVLGRGKRTQTEVPDRQPPVFGARRPSGGIAAQRRARYVSLLRQPGDERRRRLDVVEPALAGVAQQGDVDRQPESVVGAPPRRNQSQILVRQNVVAFQGTDVGRDPQQPVADRCRHKTP